MANKKLIDEEQLEAAKENPQNTYTVTFNTPFKYDGIEYSSLEFDFERLTGKDSMAISRELRQQNHMVTAPALDEEYLVRFASKASNEKIPSDALMALPIKYYNRVITRARSFLLNAE